MTTRIAVLDDYQNVAAAMADWASLDAEVTFFNDVIASDAVTTTLAGYDVVVAMRERTPFPADVLVRLPDLKLLVTTGMRNAAIDVDAAVRLGVVVCGTPSPGHATAELAFTMILNLARGFVDEVTSVRNGGWQDGLGRDVRGATIGLLGLGRLGSQVAGYAQAFGMEVIAWSENLTEERAREVGARLVDRESLFARSDFVSVHVRLSDRSAGLVSESELGLMKPTAYLVNTSRSAIVDMSALIAALDRGAIAGAALDVHNIEPLPVGHVVRSHPRILATPHIGYVTEQTYHVFYPGVVEDIAAFLGGEPIRVLS